MHFGERLWACATAFLNLITLSPYEGGNGIQTPLQRPSRIHPDWDIHRENGHLDQVTSDVPVVLTAEPGNNVEASSNLVATVTSSALPGPTFKPPGSPARDKFQCEYPQMQGWEQCSTRLERSCWLRRKSDGKRYDLFTDYEVDKPIGITRHVNLTLDKSWYAGDGMNFTAAKLFNNLYPGPWIEACWGDRLVVNVTNNLDHNGTSIHWHGIRQHRTMHMDGVNGISQCPIAPGDHFVYEFNVTQYGSSWYHSHYSVQYADGAAGPLTFHGPTSSEYDEAVSPPIIMTDWGHNSAFISVVDKNFASPTLLMNGIGDVRKWKAQNTTTVPPPFHISFEKPKEGLPIKRYLLRLINTSFDSTFVFSIDNHMLQIVSTDFVPIFPYANTSVLIGIGQRYNVIVEANPLAYNESSPIPADGNYWIRMNYAGCYNPFIKNRTTGELPWNDGYERMGILRYNDSSEAEPTSTPWSNMSTACSDETYEDIHPVLPWNVGSPVNGNRSAGYGEAFDFQQKKGANIYPLAMWDLNSDQHQDEFQPMRINYSDPIFSHLDYKGTWDPLWRVVDENYTSSEWVYLAIMGSHSDPKWGAHPIHLHGHDFALLEQKSNKVFNPKTLDLKLNNPPRRDVVLMPSGGYIVIAFKADNPGAWLVHCHIAFHISQGLGLQIMEHQSRAAEIWQPGDGALVENDRVCKNWNDWYGNRTNWDEGIRECTHIKDHPDWCFQDDSGV